MKSVVKKILANFIEFGGRMDGAFLRRICVFLAILRFINILADLWLFNNFNV
jgi:hypothetical protein